ncbi:MAG: hypothetical protein J3K34DRAFT_525862 [Monoraphidium minutum]|nr:MAG: hypothetical protein J3K34DRAFT_525862 [Monoraphidium minutum]
MGNTDAIRCILREQKRDCAALHADPIFREFRHAALQQHQHQQQQQPQQHDDGEGAAVPVIDDLDAEAMSRLFDVIKTAAVEGNKAPQGVYAEFGKPYAPCGTIVEVSNKLPRLNIDEISANRHRRPAVRKNSSMVPGAPSIFRRPLRRSLTGHAAAGLPAAAGGGDGDSGGGGGGDAGAQKARQEEANRLLRHKTAMRYTTRDRTEAAFPAAPLRQADGRRRAGRTRPNTYFSAGGAAADAGDAAGAYGGCQLPLRPLPGSELLRRHQAASGGGGGPAAGEAGATGQPFAGSGKGAFFLTQRGGVSAAGGAAEPGGAQPREGGSATAGNGRSSVDGGGAALAGARRGSASADLGGTLAATSSGAAPAAAESAARPPQPQPLTEPTRIEPGSRNPVPGWHNRFRAARQAGRGALQQDLWHRSRRRAAYRASPPLAAELTGHVMAELEGADGHLAPGWVPGTVPESPFSRADKAATQRQRKVEARATTTTRAIKKEEVAVLEHFYSALCGLVEKQRISDPLSLMLVHKSKELLEEGVLLHRPLLQQLVDAAAAFVRDCGLVRYNRFSLPLLTFVRKCVGVGADEFDAMAGAAGLRAVLYDKGAWEQQHPQQQPQQPAQQQQQPAAPGSDVAADGGSGGDAPSGGDSPPAAARAAPVPRISGASAASSAPAAAAGRPARMLSSSGASATNVPPPIAPIDMALAVASKQIVEAIASARSERPPQAGAAGPPGAGAARIPGVARGSTPQVAAAAGAAQTAAGAGAEAAGAAGLGLGAAEEGQLDEAAGLLGGGGAAAGGGQAPAEEDALPDLSLEADGLLTRRMRAQQASMCGWEGPAAARQSDKA